MKEIKHITFRNGKPFCSNCGGSQEIPFPCEISLLNMLTENFSSLHENCKKIWIEPEVNQSESETDKMNFWLLNGEHGTSSKTMFSVISGKPMEGRQSHPLDPDDFRRCYLLIKTIPEWKDKLYKMKTVSKTWENIVNNWDKLTDMLEEQLATKKANGMYEFMRELGCHL